MTSFSDVERYLNSLINYESTTPLGGSRGQPKLEPVVKACERLALPLTPERCAHIAGTVGKGSVAAMLASILMRRHTTLCFTSPHLISVKERVKLNGELIEDDLWCEGFSHITRELGREPALNLTYFESVWVFYLWCANRLRTQAHVVETGLGGSFDATNVLRKSVAVFTKIDLDHTHILGRTVEEIARDKSGIIKRNCASVSTVQSEPVQRVLDEKARAENSRLLVEAREFQIEHDLRFVHVQRGLEIADLTWPLRGEFQRHNAVTAVAAALEIDPMMSGMEILEGLKSVRVDARQQTVKGHPNLWVDVAHNPASFAALADSLRRETGYSETVALVAMLKDKDVEASLAALKGVVTEVLVTEAANPRSRSAEDLLACANRAGVTARIVAREEGYAAMLKLPDNRRGVVCGSFYLAGDFLRWLQPEAR